MLLSMQVKRLFGRCQIVGTRFPIALVHSGGLVLEVSSFGTKAKRDIIPTDAAAFLSTPAPRGKVNSCTEGHQVPYTRVEGRSISALPWCPAVHCKHATYLLSKEQYESGHDAPLILFC